MNMQPEAHAEHPHRVMHSMDAKSTPMKKSTSPKQEALVMIIVYVVLLLLGAGTGYLLAQKGGVASVSQKGTTTNTKKVAGVQDASTFKDCTTGKLEKGGADGEGTHQLIRDGGPSQTAYLISSLVDLDQYVGLSVKVCGQTLAAKKVSWLMDVGRLEVQ